MCSKISLITNRFLLLVFGTFLIVYPYVNAKNIDSLPDSVKDMLKGLHDNCVSESAVTEDLISSVNNGEFKEEQTLKCYMKCLLTSVGIMDDSGVVDWETYEGLLPDFMQEYGKKVFDKCSLLKPAGDACEVAFIMNKCSYEVDPTIYMLW